MGLFWRPARAKKTALLFSHRHFRAESSTSAGSGSAVEGLDQRPLTHKRDCRVWVERRGMEKSRNSGLIVEEEIGL
jgi:hypothetical protein